MFTGLIGATGQITGLDTAGPIRQLKITSSLVKEDLHLGESIAVNGVCLTLTGQDTQSFSADISSESLRMTTLGQLKIGARVNLERALRLTDRLGGHLVSGHVDAISCLRAIYPEGSARRLEFDLPAEIAPYVSAKGSIAIDGVSLTVNQVGEKSFSVMVIPHSLSMTTLPQLRPGSPVNLESDLLARYVETLLNARGAAPSKSGAISREFLAKNGYL
jgi:riboflavin synthase